MNRNGVLNDGLWEKLDYMAMEQLGIFQDYNRLLTLADQTNGRSHIAHSFIEESMIKQEDDDTTPPYLLVW